MGGQGRDKHNLHGNSVNPSYHATRAEQRQEPAEMCVEGKKDVLAEH